jgi:hypothetical protein
LRRFEKISNKMSAGGARPGAGRKAGKPNRLSEQRVEQARRQGKRLPPESLLLIAENSMAMAERYQPELTDPTTREKSPNPLHNEERYAFWLAASREAYKAAAPYYAPRLHAVAMQLATPALDNKQEGRADPRETLWQTYLEMRRRGELALKAVSGPKTNGPAQASAPVPQDDADGVAV